MSHSEQFALFKKEFGDYWNTMVVPGNPKAVWSYTGSFSMDNMTVTPSIDASASGHRHGHIIKGEIK